MRLTDGQKKGSRKIKLKRGYGLWQEHGKEQVNKLLWMWLPGNMTLFEAEDLAVKIHSMITDEWIKRHPDEKDDEA